MNRLAWAAVLAASLLLSSALAGCGNEPPQFGEVSRDGMAVGAYAIAYSAHEDDLAELDRAASATVEALQRVFPGSRVDTIVSTIRFTVEVVDDLTYVANTGEVVEVGQKGGLSWFDGRMIGHVRISRMPCMGDSALGHEMAHLVRYYTAGGTDPDHLDNRLFTRGCALPSCDALETVELASRCE